MKAIKIEFIGLIIFILMVLWGTNISFRTLRGDVSITEPGVKLAIERQKMKSTYPGIALIVCGTTIGVASIIKAKN
jgi:hypothetical protein